MTNRQQIGLNVKWGVRLGLAFAFVYSLIAMVIFALQLPNDGAEALRQFLLAVSVYTIGGVTAGAVVGLLRPLTKQRVGAIAVGIVAATPVFFGGAVAISGGISKVGHDLRFSIALCSVTLGAFAGNYMWQQARSK